MNKNSFTKKFLSLLLVGTLLASLFCGTTLVARAGNAAPTVSVYHDILEQNAPGTIENTYPKAANLSSATGNSSLYHGYKPSNASQKMVWYHEDIVSFYLDVMGYHNLAEERYSEYYLLSASADGVTWTPLEFTRERNVRYPSGNTSERLTVKSIPVGTNYIRVMADLTNVTSSWRDGTVLGAGYSYSVTKPVFTALYKNYKGLYANPLLTGGTATRAVKLTVENLTATDTISATKDGAPFALSLDSTENGYIFTEGGSYTVTATNAAGSESFSFMLAEATEPTRVVTQKTYDILTQKDAGTSDYSYYMLHMSNYPGWYTLYPNAAGKYVKWNFENIVSFAVDTYAASASADFENDFIFQGSKNGTDWYSLKFTKALTDPQYIYPELVGGNPATAQPSYRLTLTVPDGTNYIKLTSNSTAWSRGIVKVMCETATEVTKPTVSAAYKNYFGYYANPFSADATIVKDAEIKVTGMELPEITEAKVEIQKDGTPVTAADYYDSTADAYHFSEKGAYILTASNKAGEQSISFTIADKANVAARVPETIVDDIYNDCKTKAIDRTSIENGPVMNVISTTTGASHLVAATGKYYMFPYNAGSDNPDTYATWYNEEGITKFTVATLNVASITEKQIRAAYSFYYSADGENWKPVDFEIGENYAVAGLTSNAVSKLLHINMLPDDTKYVRFHSLTTRAQLSNGCSLGIIRAEYSYARLLTVPEISGIYANMAGRYCYPLVSGGTATRKAMLKMTEMETGGTVTVIKDGNTENTADYYSAEDDAYYFDKNGEYKVIAENAAGKREFKFTVALKTEDGYYVEQKNVYDILNENIDGAIEKTYSNNPVSDALTGKDSRPVLYSYFPSDAEGKYTNDDLYMLWKEENISLFSLDVLAASATTDAEFETRYILHSSADGKNWTRLSFDRTILQVYQNDCVTYRLTVKVIPEGTKYVRLSYGGTGYDWKIGAVTGVSLSYFHKIETPTFSAEYKNLYGTYANVLKDGGKAIRAAKVSITDIGEGTDGVVEIKKNNAAVNVGDYYSAAEDAYLFDSDGEYKITAKNKQGKASLSFTVALKAEDPIELKTVTDNIYETGTTKAFERVDLSGGDYKLLMGINNLLADSHKDLGYVSADLAGERYVMWPYNYGKETPETYATWKSETGFGSFSVFTLSGITTAEATYAKYYSFLCSADGINWTEAEFAVGEKVAFPGLTEKALSRRLTVSKIPDGTKYIRFLSLTTNATCAYGRYNGIIGAEYTTVISKPVINANFKDIQGMYINPLCEGAAAPSVVRLEATDVGEGVPDSTLTVKKNGKVIEFVNGEDLTENGSYEVTATNRKGTATLEFSIKKETKAPASATYVFTGGLLDATEQYSNLIGITPDGADEKFTRGDGAVIINDTVANGYKGGNQAFAPEKWGLPEGATNLTVGSDSKGYKKDGYFYFSNTDEKGNKYTAISITYSVPVNNPKANLAIYSADKFDGNYKLVSPTSVTFLRTSERVNVYKAIYYLGTAGSVVKVQYTPKAPVTSLWQGSMLAIQELTKLALPTLSATSDGKTLSFNDVTKKDVKLKVAGEKYWFITKDGEEYKKPKNNTLTEDGYYTVYACNYSGTASVSFYLAKRIPVVQMIDVLGNNLSSGDLVDDDVHIIAHNAKTVEILRDGELYSNKKDIVLNLNGAYTITATNAYGTFVAEVVINRPLPTLLGYNFRNARVNDGDIVPTSVVYTVDTADKYTIKRGGKAYTPKEEGTLTEEGSYVITATNDAGKVTLSFTIKYNAPLAAYKHTGNTVAVIDYENGAKLTDSQYKLEEIELDKGKALQSTWTGFTGPVLHPLLMGEAAESYIIYKCVGFDSFIAHVVHLPELPTEQIYEIYASVNGKDYQKLECEIVEDQAYVARSTNFNKYRLIAKNIPKGAKYIKVLVRGDEAKYLWSRCITSVEYSYDSSKIGKLDVDDTIFMMGDAEEGSEVVINLYNSETVVPKSVFEAFKDSDKTLTINLMDKNQKSLYRLSFNGLNNRESMDFNVKVNNPNSAGLKYVKAYDKDAFSVSFSQDGEWTMDMSFAVVMGKENNGKRYALYKFTDGVLELIDRQLVPVSGFLTFQITGNGDYVISAVTDILEDNDEDEYEEIIEEPQKEEKDKKYIMVVNRKKFVPASKETLSTLVIVLICVAGALLAGAAVTTVLLIIKHKKKNKK